MKMFQDRKGSAVVELSLLLPWFVFMFIGTVDMGFYGYALISLESAVRVAALYTSSSVAASTDAATACTYVVEELKSNINMSTITTCGGTSPVSVTATNVAASSSPDGNAAAAKLSITYTTPKLFNYSGVMKSQITITRTLIMRIRG